ncbi:MAG: RHS repeat-associated core domain-containing protein [Paludibacteraceae bacterium]|nr:RHS repeat-associated core domain-containing protein [Paludibacteraceae bacterium]
MEETAGRWQSPYYFNAKELDEETGLYYYGARYLDPTGARWLSADPMLWNNPDKTPYHYCSGNPVRFVDPNGLFDTEMDAENFAFANNLERYQIHKVDDGFYSVYDDVSGNSYAYNGSYSVEGTAVGKRNPSYAVDNYLSQKFQRTGDFSDWLRMKGLHKLDEKVAGSTYSRVKDNSMNNCIKAYWTKKYEKTGDLGHWMKSKGMYDFDEIVEEKFGPLYRGAIMFITPVAITNDVKIITTGSDLYGNDASSFIDQGVAWVDLLSCGFVWGCKLGLISEKVGTARNYRMADNTNTLTTWYGIIYTSYTEYTK